MRRLNAVPEGALMVGVRVLAQSCPALREKLRMRSTRENYDPEIAGVCAPGPEPLLEMLRELFVLLRRLSAMAAETREFVESSVT